MKNKKNYYKKVWEIFIKNKFQEIGSGIWTVIKFIPIIIFATIVVSSIAFGVVFLLGVISSFFPDVFMYILNFCSENEGILTGSWFLDTCSVGVMVLFLLMALTIVVIAVVLLIKKLVEWIKDNWEMAKRQARE